MKKVVMLLAVVMMILLSVNEAKSLPNFWYSGYAYNTSGTMLPNTTVASVRVTITQGASTVFQETHSGVVTDAFATFNLNVGTVGAGLAGVTITANTKIKLECNNGDGWITTGANTSLATVIVNNYITPGAIELPDGKMLVGNSLNEAAAVFMGGDATLSNTGALTIADGRVFTNKIADGNVTTIKLANGAVTPAKMTAGDYSSVITSGTYDINITGSAGSTVMANNLAGAAWQIPYQSALNTTSMLALGTANYVLMSSGASSAPTFGLIGAANISDGSITNVKLANSAITVNTTAGQLTGGAAVSLGGSLTLGLATAGTAGTYGNSTTVPVFTTDAYGRVTSVTNTAIAFPAEVDGVIGNEVVDAANGTLVRSGAGTTVDPYKLALNLNNANVWVGAQTGNITASGVSLAAGTSIVAAINDGATVGTINTDRLSSAVVLETENPAAGDIFGTFFAGLNINNNAVTTAKIANGAVTQAKLSAVGAVNGYVLKTDGTNLVWGDATVYADYPISGTGIASDHLVINHDATLVGATPSTALGLNLANPNTWTALQTFNAGINGTTATMSGLVTGGNFTTAGTYTGNLVNAVATGNGLTGGSFNNSAARTFAIDYAYAGTWTGQQIFTVANPQTPLAPAVGNDLTNKTYVDDQDNIIKAFPFITVGNVAGLTAERAVAVNTTLTGTDGGANGSYTFGINLSNENTWLATQTFPATLAQGDVFVASLNAATAASLNADVLKYDATLKVTTNQLGIDLNHANDWTAEQTYSSNVLIPVGSTIYLGSTTDPIATIDGGGTIVFAVPGLGPQAFMNMNGYGDITYLNSGLEINAGDAGKIVNPMVTTLTGADGDGTLTPKGYVDDQDDIIKGYPFLTVGNVADLTAERAVAVNSSLTGTDGGVNGSYTFGINLANTNIWSVTQTFSAGLTGTTANMSGLVTGGNFTTAGTYTGNLLNAVATGTGLTGGSFNNSAARTFAIDYTHAGTWIASQAFTGGLTGTTANLSGLVTGGNFTTAGTYTGNLVNAVATGAGLTGGSFNNSAARTFVVDQAYAFNWTGAQTWANTTTFNGLATFNANAVGNFLDFQQANIGLTNADIFSVSATTTFNSLANFDANVKIGNTAAELLTVNSTTQIDGPTTFSLNVTAATAPTLPDHLANKAYVDLLKGLPYVAWQASADLTNERVPQAGVATTYATGANYIQFDVNYDDNTIGVATNALYVKDGGITTLQIFDETILNEDIADATIENVKLVNSSFATSSTGSLTMSTPVALGGTLTADLNMNYANSWVSTQTFADVDINGGAIDGTVIGANSAAAATFTTLTATTSNLGTVASGTWNGSVIADTYVDNTLTITGGSINGTPVGATTPSTGKFTTLNVNNAYAFPVVDGIANQYLQTNGAGVVSWATIINTLQGAYDGTGSGAGRTINNFSAATPVVINAPLPANTALEIGGVATSSATIANINAAGNTALVTKDWIENGGISVFTTTTTFTPSTATNTAIAATNNSVANPTITIQNNAANGTALSIPFGNVDLSGGQIKANFQEDATLAATVEVIQAGATGKGITVLMSGGGTGNAVDITSLGSGAALKIDQGKVVLAPNLYAAIGALDLNYTVHRVTATGAYTAAAGTDGQFIYFINNSGGATTLNGTAVANGTCATFVYYGAWYKVQ